MNIKHLANSLDDFRIRNIILNNAKKENQIIHGAMAYNYQSPDFLKKETKDFDILTNKPKYHADKVAKEIRRLVNKEVVVSKGVHKGTYKIKINNQTIVDYTQLKREPKTINSWGNRLKSIKSIKRNVQRLVKNPRAEFRRTKDLDTLSRIKEIERLERFNF